MVENRMKLLKNHLKCNESLTVEPKIYNEVEKFIIIIMILQTNLKSLHLFAFTPPILRLSMWWSLRAAEDSSFSVQSVPGWYPPFVSSSIPPGPSPTPLVGSVTKHYNGITHIHSNRWRLLLTTLYFCKPH